MDFRGVINAILRKQNWDDWDFLELFSIPTPPPLPIQQLQDVHAPFVF